MPRKARHQSTAEKIADLTAELATIAKAKGLKGKPIIDIVTQQLIDHRVPYGEMAQDVVNPNTMGTVSPSRLSATEASHIAEEQSQQESMRAAIARLEMRCCNLEQGNKELQERLSSIGDEMWKIEHRFRLHRHVKDGPAVIPA